MKKIKLGLLAVALFGAVAAFATKAQSNDMPPCGNPGTEICVPNGDLECCILSTNPEVYKFYQE